MLSSFIYILVIYYMQSTSALDTVSYDINTVTAGDYTVEMDITSKMYQSFLDNQFEEVRDIKDENGNFKWTRALCLKDYLVKEVAKVLTQYQKDRLAYDDPGHEKKEPVEIKVFDVTFAYNNNMLIKLLVKRGTAITNLDFDTVDKLDADILELIGDYKIDNGVETGMYMKLTKPVCAFVTFETDDGKNEALAYSEKKSWYKPSKTKDIAQMTICNDIPKFKDTSEPTNIIWENRHIKGVNYGARVCGAVMIAIFMLTIAFFVIFFFKQA